LPALNKGAAVPAGVDLTYCVRIQKRLCQVMPAEAGIQELLKSLDSGPGSSPGQALFRRNAGFPDESSLF
jgi:hypothetical protein